MTIQLSLPPSFAKSWKTTLGGAAAAALGFFQAYKIHDIHQIISDPTTLSMFVLAVVGFVAKDSNVSGGTVAQPSSAEVVAASTVVAEKA